MPDRSGKRIDLGAMVETGRRRVGGSDAPAEEGSSGGAHEESASRPAAPPSRPAAPPIPERPLPATRERARPDSGGPPPSPPPTLTVPLYVRIPESAKERLEQAAHELRRDHATMGEMVAALLVQEVDPYTVQGLAALRARLDRYRHPPEGR
jgi:hypothetical protein